MSATMLRAQAAAKEDLADRIDVEARALPELLDPVLARTGPAVWRGPAADAFGTDARRWAGTLDAQADVLVGVARRLRLHAAQLREEAQRIEAAEAAEAARLANMDPQQRRAYVRMR